VADVEAHITGTVWKIEVAVGGKVAEIRVEEGQSVSEGDVLVVLE
jgi:biotin carboxyl carrier protein